MQEPSASEVAAALERVYASAEFAQQRRVAGLLQAIRQLWSSFWEWVWETLTRWGVPQDWRPLLTWVLIVVLAGLAVWAVVSLIITVTGLRRAPRAAEAAQAITLHARRAPSWEEAARAAAAEGRLRDAALALYLAAVMRLEERGILAYHASKTPGDYRREVRADPVLGRTFDRFVRQLLPLAFGARAPDSPSFESLRTTATELGVNV